MQKPRKLTAGTGKKKPLEKEKHLFYKSLILGFHVNFQGCKLVAVFKPFENNMLKLSRLRSFPKKSDEHKTISETTT